MIAQGQEKVHYRAEPSQPPLNPVPSTDVHRRKSLRCKLEGSLGARPLFALKADGLPAGLPGYSRRLLSCALNLVLGRGSGGGRPCGDRRLLGCVGGWVGAWVRAPCARRLDLRIGSHVSALAPARLLLKFNLALRGDCIVGAAVHYDREWPLPGLEFIRGGPCMRPLVPSLAFPLLSSDPPLLSSCPWC